MTKISAGKRLFSLIISVLCVIIALAYIIYGKQIADALDGIIGVSYGNLIEYFDEVNDGELELHIIDVGQADSTLIRTKDAVILIDTGSEESEADLTAHLDACSFNKIDYLICTHPHSDHIGGADKVIRQYEVTNLLIPDLYSDEHSFEMMLRAAGRNGVNTAIATAGDTYTLGELEFTILGPLNEYKDANDMSLVVRLTYGDTVFLFTGDAGDKVEADLISAYSEDELDCDFYKIAHHGANTASSEEFLAVITPNIAASSSGYENEYSHPRGEVVERLKDAGCGTILRTDTMGTCVIVSDGKSISVKVPQNP